MSDPPRQQKLDEFRQARQDRLRAVELQVAQFGDLHTPAHLLTERDRLINEIQQVEKMERNRRSTDLYAEMDPVQRHEQLVRLWQKLAEQVYDVQRKQRQDDERREQRQAEVDDERHQHERQHTRLERWLVTLTTLVTGLVGFRVRDVWRGR